MINHQKNSTSSSFIKKYSYLGQYCLSFFFCFFLLSLSGCGGAGGGAPLGGGTITLLIMGALYGGNKLYHFYKENKNELED